MVLLEKKEEEKRKVIRKVIQEENEKTTQATQKMRKCLGLHPIQRLILFVSYD